MRLFRKGSTPITLIGHDEIYFILQGGSGEGQILDPFPFDRFLTNEADLSVIPDTFHHQVNSVMVVPDYWLESVSFPFQSRKRSLAEAFLERKLRADFPEIPEVKDFYEYFFHQTDKDETAVYAYFLRDPTFFQLYDQLVRWNLHPRRITTPAFLWASQLKERIPDFHKGGNAFVHILSNECFLYFFFEGRFLFSRQITLPEIQGDSSDQIETLTYETNGNGRNGERPINLRRKERSYVHERNEKQASRFHAGRDRHRHGDHRAPDRWGPQGTGHGPERQGQARGQAGG